MLSIRVPDSVEYCRAIGIDIEEWLEAGYADILFTTSYLHMNEWDYSAELGHRYGIPVYPSLDESRVRSELPRHKRNCVRGRNYVNTLSKTYFASIRGVTEVPVRIADGFSGVAEAGKDAVMTASVFIYGKPEALSVCLNDRRIEMSAKVNARADLDPSRTEYVLTADLPAEFARIGTNTFRFDSPESIELLDLWVDVTYS